MQTKVKANFEGNSISSSVEAFSSLTSTDFLFFILFPSNSKSWDQVFSIRHSRFGRLPALQIQFEVLRRSKTMERERVGRR